MFHQHVPMCRHSRCNSFTPVGHHWAPGLQRICHVPPRRSPEAPSGRCCQLGEKRLVGIIQTWEDT